MTEVMEYIPPAPFMLPLSTGGMTSVHIPVVWSLVVPPRIHVFLWLLAHGKIMTRDNQWQIRRILPQSDPRDRRAVEHRRRLRGKIAAAHASRNFQTDRPG